LNREGRRVVLPKTPSSISFLPVAPLSLVQFARSPSLSWVPYKQVPVQFKLLHKNPLTHHFMRHSISN
jgi:hypothetical protein